MMLPARTTSLQAEPKRAMVYTLTAKMDTLRSVTTVASKSLLVRSTFGDEVHHQLLELRRRKHPTGQHIRIRSCQPHWTTCITQRAPSLEQRKCILGMLVKDRDTTASTKLQMQRNSVVLGRNWAFTQGMLLQVR